jgi:glycosyltransferase involved in cell wall biosynthesis
LARPAPATVAICTAQTLFARGGAELLVDALARELRARGHQVDVVRLPFSWDKDDLLQNALLWRLVPVGAERVIVTTFPSWLVRHPRKVVWLFHQHRKLYDLDGTPFSEFGAEPGDDEARRLIRAMDTRFLGEATRLFTISRTVSDRLRRFNGLASEPLYHPPPLAGVLGCRAYGDFVLVPTRLEAHKRPGLLLEALRHTRSGLRAVITGDGPLAGELARTVARHGLGSRVRLAGHVDEATLADLYADCAMVAYTPYDEDYGYVPLEAFLARKPVVTTSDAGGVLEFVVDEATGLVVAPDPVALAGALDRLAESPALGRRLGEAGHERARRIRWDDVIPRLLEAP